MMVSRRLFSRLPADCADRRDAIALAIALAVEACLAEDTAVPAQPPAARPDPGWPSSTGGSVPSTGSKPGTRAAKPVPSNPAIQSAASPNLTTAAEPDSTPAPDDSAEAEHAIVNVREAGSEPTSGERSRTAPVDHEEPSADADRTRALAANVYAGAGWLIEGLPWFVWTGLLGTRLSLSRRFALDATLLGSPPSDLSVATGDVRGWLAGATFSGCMEHTAGAVSLHGCVGILGSVCRIIGRGYDRPYPAANVPWIAGAVRLAADWPHQAPVMLRLLAQGHANMVRPELRVDGSTEVERTAPFGALLGGAVVVEVN
jgi:hypothetical protein